MSLIPPWKMLENNKLETTLWKTADKLRNNMDAAEYKHVVQGLILLKYISDAFDGIEHILVEEISVEWENQVPAIKDICLSERVFYVPKTSRWKYLQARAKLPTQGFVNNLDLYNQLHLLISDITSEAGVSRIIYEF